MVRWGIVFVVAASHFGLCGHELRRNLLTNHLAAFGNIARDSYQNKTSKLQKLTVDLTTQTDLASAINTLDFASCKTEIEAANTAFDTRYVDRSVDGGLTNISKTKVYNKRPEITAAYF